LCYFQATRTPLRGPPQGRAGGGLSFGEITLSIKVSEKLALAPRVYDFRTKLAFNRANMGKKAVV
jgi:hypothetical protein